MTMISRTLSALAALMLAGTSAASCSPSPTTPASGSTPEASHSHAVFPTPDELAGLLPGMPPPLDPNDIYAADRPGRISAHARHARQLVYVPNFGSHTVSIIDPHTYRVIRTQRVGKGPQHVVPSWDLQTLWVTNNSGNSLTPINPVTSAFGRPVKVQDPYNLYFTPDGRFAIVMAETEREIVFRDPHTMAIKHVLPVGCGGVNHADFSVNGRYFIVTCEFSGDLLKVDTERQQIVGRLHLPGHAMPQDIKIAPDGRTCTSRTCRSANCGCSTATQSRSRHSCRPGTERTASTPAGTRAICT
jgi:YVTN family beta-propeller protein